MKTDGKRANSTKLVVLGGLSVVGAAICFRMMWSGPQSAPGASVTDAPDALVLPGEPTPNRIDGTSSVTWPTDVARDPFNSKLVFPTEVRITEAPAVTATTDPVDVAALAREKIQLKGTVLGEHPQAMMNGRVFYVGGVVEGFKIVEIGTNQVTVERDGSRVVIEAH